jgi:hypothetical protein
MIKNCIQCGKEINISNRNQKLCLECRKEHERLNYQKQNNKRTNKKKIEYDNNFINCTENNGISLTIKGFDEISRLKYAAYRFFYKESWLQLIIKYNKYDELMKYLKQEYLDYININGYLGVADFAKKHHKYITYELISDIGTEIFLDFCGVKYYRNDIEDYKNNFNDLVMELGYIPLYSEFLKNSKIMVGNYKKRFNLIPPIYDNIVKMYVSDSEFEEYLQNNKDHKYMVTKDQLELGRNTLSLEELEIEFKRVFDLCFEQTTKYPSMNLFNKLSSHDESVYRNKLSLSWNNVCKYYGYEFDHNPNIFENYVLKQIEFILKTTCEPQMVFPWLIGIKNFPLFCDGFYSEYGLVVETDGIQHKVPVRKFGGYKRFEIQQANDRLKDKLVKEHGYKILHIDIDSNWTNTEYLTQRVNDILKDIEIA